MGAIRALAPVLFVALVVGAGLGAIFWQLMEYERLMGNTTEYWIWVWEWIGFTVILTLLLWRQEIRLVPRGRKSAKPTASSESSSTQEKTPE